MAEKISEVRAGRDRLTAALAEAESETGQVMDVVRRHHDDTHTGVWRYCDNPVCRLVSTLDYASDARHHL